MVSYTTKYTGTIWFSNCIPWYLTKGVGKVYTNKNLHKYVFRNFIHYYQNLEAVKTCFSGWMYKLWNSQTKIIIQRYLKMSYQSIKRYGGNLNAYSVHLLNRVRLFVTPWTAACQAFLSITNSRSSPRLMSIELVMPSNQLILCHPLLLLPSIFPSIRVFSNESTLHMRWPKYWSFSFSISPSNEHPGLISFRMD